MPCDIAIKSGTHCNSVGTNDFNDVAVTIRWGDTGHFTTGGALGFSNDVWHVDSSLDAREKRGPRMRVVPGGGGHMDTD